MRISDWSSDVCSSDLLLWERLQPRSWDSRRQQTPLPLRLVRAQLLDAFEVARLDAGHVLAAEARTVEAHAGELRSGHGGFQVGQVLVQQPVDRKSTRLNSSH